VKSVKFSLLVQIDGGEEKRFEIGSEVLSRMSSGIPDAADSQDILHFLAMSPSSEVRADVAYKDCISEETVELLANDNSIDVRRRLCGQTPFSEWATTEKLIEFINLDLDCARTIAGRINEYSNADTNEVAAVLRDHSDPDVRRALAGCWGIAKSIAKQLLKDADPDVRAAAKRTLD
jgi:hypothetical protein